MTNNDCNVISRNDFSGNKSFSFNFKRRLTFIIQRKMIKIVIDTVRTAKYSGRRKVFTNVKPPIHARIAPIK